jgi:hypothetical protein
MLATVTTDWLQTLILFAALIVAIMQYAKGRAASPGFPDTTSITLKTKKHTPITQKIRDIAGLFLLRDFWPHFLLFVLASWKLAGLAFDSSPTTRTVVLWMVVCGGIAFTCFVWLLFRAYMYFAILETAKKN